MRLGVASPVSTIKPSTGATRSPRDQAQGSARYHVHAEVSTLRHVLPIPRVAIDAPPDVKQNREFHVSPGLLENDRRFFQSPQTWRDDAHV